MTKLWAGRFSEDVANSVLDYTQTADIDTRLIQFDLWGSIAHVLMLSYQGILPQEEGRAIVQCLLSLIHQNTEGTLILDKNLEDVHLNIEHIVITKLGLDIGGKMHTARSRNDQVVTDTRMYLRNELLEIQTALCELIKDLLALAERHYETIAVGYTHSQGAQPISLAYWLTAYASMFIRDMQRLSASYACTNQNPLGACALAGTSFPINRQVTTKLLGFDKLLLHALDATSSRDFIIETVAALSISISNFSKLAEEIVLWSSFEFNLIEVGDAFSTGSSIMPQKKNPVVAELTRGRTGRIYGTLIQLLTMVKAISTGYSCDLQEDKPLLWQALDVMLATINITREQFQDFHFNSTRATDICWQNFSTATELANYLVSHKDYGFREAHHITGDIVRKLLHEGASLIDIPKVSQLLRQMDITIDLETLHNIVDPIQVIHHQKSQGGTAPETVQEIVASLRNELTDLQGAIDERRNRLQSTFNSTLKTAQLFIDETNIALLL